jgi:erythromycin esterase-like protein
MQSIHRPATKLLMAIWLMAGCMMACAAAASEAPHIINQSGELDRLVKDVCHKQVVLLGEDDNHGSGKTLEVKVDLVERLINECDFSAVFFESQIYDFFSLEGALTSNTATPAQLADAIGGLWSTTRESDRLVSFLLDEASTGRVKIRGLDPQIGGATQLFSQRFLPARLTASLDPVRRAVCESEILRLTNWQYDDQSPYDDATRKRLRSCLNAIEGNAAKQPSNDTAAITSLLARNLSGYLDMSSGNGFNVRDRAMFDNFVWHRAHMPSSAKIIVWCATVHAAKDGRPISNELVPMGSYIHQSVGNDAAAIGFTALTGSYGRMGHVPTEMPAASADSLEAKAFANSTDDIRYIDNMQLKQYGAVTARPIDYGKSQKADWESILDGVVVLRHERAPEYVRSATPQQAAPQL